jgi:hypothetical protein
MSDNRASRDDSEIERITAIADGDSDGPVLMLNLNRYSVAAGYPSGDNYKQYMSLLEALLPQVDAKILWRRAVAGQPVGEQPIDEILAAWYPSHRAFLELPKAPGGKQNFRLRRLCVEYAVIHRCPGNPVAVELA